MESFLSRFFIGFEGRRGLLFGLAGAAALCVWTVLPAGAIGKTSLDLELDPYYTAFGLSVPFQEGSDESDVETDELTTYSGMLARAIVPRFMVIEGSVNPLPLLGAVVRDESESFYRKQQSGASFNLLEAATAGFEEPYALSVFLGKVIDFSKGTKTLGRAQKGYVGYLFSGGNYHIMNLLVVPDNWVEAEWKVKGDQQTPSRKMSWSFRFGAKIHGNPEIQDTYYLGLRRSRTDYKTTRLSFLLSSSFEYRIDLGRRERRALSHFILVEKNFPVTKRNWTFSLGMGYLWVGQDKYSGALAQRRLNNETQYLLRPNLKF
ncbi:MAG: hypothetical protein AAB091_00330 [Elusimicrobiota bacterium]